MNLRNLTTCTVTIALLAACSSSPDENATSGGKPNGKPIGKSSAPVKIEDMSIGPRDASIRLSFDRAARNVTVTVNGSEGLVVLKGKHPVSGEAFAAGATEDFKVSFEPGAGRSYLGVHVEGTFDGIPQFRTLSFPVGTPTREQEAAAGQGVEVDSEGRRIKIPGKKD